MKVRGQLITQTEKEIHICKVLYWLELPFSFLFFWSSKQSPTGSCVETNVSKIMQIDMNQWDMGKDQHDKSRTRL